MTKKDAQKGREPSIWEDLPFAILGIILEHKEIILVSAIASAATYIALSLWL